jgi:prolyl-tRNA synthetase
VIPLNVADAEVQQIADRYVAELEQAGIEVLYDDRDARPGVKFKDADLIGIPLRIVIGGKGLKDGHVELKWRTSSEPDKVPVAEGARTAIQWLKEKREEQTQLVG